MKHKGYAKYIVNSVNRAVQEIMKMSNAEGLSKEDAKQLQLKATQLAEKLKTVQAEYNAVSKSKILVREDGTIIEQLVGGEDENKLNDLEMAKKANELTIAELEKKKEEDGLSRKEKGELKAAKTNLKINKEEISELAFEPEQIKLDEVYSDKENKQFVKQKRGNFEKPDRETAPVTITKIDGSPTIATNKHISMIQHKGIFPVDPTMMAALAGYSKW